MNRYVVSKNNKQYVFYFKNNCELNRVGNDWIESHHGFSIEVWWKRNEWNGECGNPNDKWVWIDSFWYDDRKAELSLLFNKRTGTTCREYIKRLGFKVVSADINADISNIADVMADVPKLDNEWKRIIEKEVKQK